MAAWTSIIWHDVVHLIEFGNSTCVIPRNTLYIRCRGQQIERGLLKVKQTNSGSDKQRQILLIHRENVNMEDIQITQAFRGVYFNIVGETYHKVRTLEKKVKLFQQRKPDSNSIMLTTKNSFARLGWQVKNIIFILSVLFNRLTRQTHIRDVHLTQQTSIACTITTLFYNIV